MPRGGRQERRLATVLFTDIVGSSEIASALGDRRWKVLLVRHHLIVRRALKRHGGSEIDDAGDGFFCSFRDQADAIRCACEISEAVQELGIDVRAGLHVGQAEVVGRKLGGTTVNVAARVMAEAGAGEVLVSGVMRDLTAGSGFAFEDRGSKTLKGIPGTWPVFAVTGVDGSARRPMLEPEDAAVRLDAVQPPPLLERPRWRLAVAGIASVVVAGATMVVLVRNEPPPPPTVVPSDSLVRIDPASATIIAATSVANPFGTQLAVVSARREVWVLSKESTSISVVDADANRVSSSFGVDRSQDEEGIGYGMAFMDGSIWVTAGTEVVERIHPVTHQVLAKVPVPGRPTGLAVGLGKVWVSIPSEGLVVAIDPGLNEVVGQVDLEIAEFGLGVVASDALWASALTRGQVIRIDPESGDLRVIDVGLGPSELAFGFGSVWVCNAADGTVSRIDPASGAVTKTVRVGEQSFYSFCGVAAAEDGIWVAVPSTQEVVRIDPETNTVVDRVPVQHTPDLVVAAFGSIWVTVE
jgi:class 3 adenylate cyclase/DNA-binding beta-propeller fold protein YncE